MRISKLVKKVLLAGAFLVMLAPLAACSSGGVTAGTGNAISNAQQGVDDKQYAFVQPLPYFPFSQIRQNVIEAEAIDALGIDSTTFFFVQGIDHPVFTCPSIGVPVPATDSISNPLIAQWNSGGSSNGYAIAGVSVAQDEPDGVFPGDTTGTNTLCVNGQGKEFLGYNEAYDISFTAQAHWDTTLKQIVVDGAPVLPVCKIKETGYDSNGNPTAEEVCTDPVHNGKPPADVVINPVTASASPSAAQ